MADAPAFSIACPTRIRFGPGTHRELPAFLPAEARTIAFVQGQGGSAAEPVLNCLREQGLDPVVLRCAGEPTVGSVNAACEALNGAVPDAVVACGGGSVIDTGKVLSFLLSHNLRLGEDFETLDAHLLATPARVPCIALPTTAGTGAEVTANAVLGVPSRAAKISLRGRAITPEVALVDPELMRSAPMPVKLHSGLDAVTQVIEAYVSAARTPFSDALSRPAIAAGLDALRRVIETDSPQAMCDLSWVSLSSGLALANGGLGAAHGLASVLGACSSAPHGALCGRLLPPVLRRNHALAAVGDDAQRRLSESVGEISRIFPPHHGADPLSGLERWMDMQGLPRLADWSIHRESLGDLAVAAVTASSSRKNPVPLTAKDLAEILQDAF
ncbi:iron-containing alcohol dehydrogenase [Defluviimonas sp. WL0024]|uniref:Iron-containing alcohol dehydrogenase n=2 Tax=Albidovulum TaxID=205889 RepID=A0ABT3J6H7_9RHOB|nr:MULTISPECIES: iron-containing alcohol dehydrogenase [Defluviimonas]MCU9850014.1 iron-containing alcohol dehydrogenase [Defluviimonas sp. WL0024]MCW3783287.1 iron-containing alcohol dehydrogenase [Defluviimonas salinarum]